MDIEPALLRAGPGAVAFVIVSVEDRTGAMVTDQHIDIKASEGTIGALRPNPDGTFTAEYTPLHIDQPRDVRITASTESLRSTVKLQLLPRVVRISSGPWVGYQSNFGGVNAVVGGIDIDVRTRALGESVMFRFGAAAYGFRTQTSTGGQSTDLRSAVYPGTLAVLLRRDRGLLGLWGGGGGSLAVHHVDLRFGEERVSSGLQLLGGPTIVAGVAYRAGLGELVLEGRSIWLNGGAGDVAFSGNVGGLSAGLGYRLIY